MKTKGFSLIELLLLMVIMAVIIISSTMYMGQKNEAIRSDKAVAQMHYVLNAALAYYIANGKWPDPDGSYIYYSSGSAGELQPDYLPAVPIPAFGGVYFYTYHLTTDSEVPANNFAVVFYVGKDTLKQRAIGNAMAGRLPHGYYDASLGFVFASVDIPGQNLNNATAINFAGLYHHGACVPVPTCPDAPAGSATSNPQIFVVPVSVSGVNDPNSIDSKNIYPLSSFTAFSTATGATPPACPGGTAVACSPVGGTPPSQLYWRVCLQVVTQRGNVQDTRTDAWGDRVTLGAFTRCNISNEPTGSGFNVYGH